MSPNSSSPGQPNLAQPIKRRVFYSIGLPVWVFLGFIFAQIFVVALLWVLKKLGVSFDSFNEIIFSSIAGAIIYGLAIFLVIGVPWFIKKRRTTTKDLGIQRFPNWMDISWVVPGFVAYIVLTGLVSAAALYLFPSIDSAQSQDTGFATVGTQFEYVLAFLSLVIIAPIAEETLFRGYLFGKLRKHAPLWVAILITSALFALVHFQVNVGLDVFALSIVLCLLRVTTGTIWPSILLHMLKNGIAFYFLFINPSLLSTLGG
ncbi:MAG: CPBP family intramembrane glutamic endopeptidase [Candidatus Saccharimonadaceae bacterium]